MAQQQQLREAFDAWEQCSRREGNAIRAGDWPAARECQEAKARLQSRILALGDMADADAGLRQLVSKLIEAEMRNNDLVAECRRVTASAIRESDRASRTLRRVQKCYVPPSTGLWNSYS